MRKRPTRRSTRAPTALALPTKLVELQMAAPQVVAHRVARMASSGPVLSKRDQKEFTGMVTEKQMAFWMSWWAMGAEVLRLQTEFARASIQAFLTTGSWLQQQNIWQASQKLEQASTRIASKGLTPIHRKAVSNARRLNRSSS